MSDPTKSRTPASRVPVSRAPPLETIDDNSGSSEDEGALTPQAAASRAPATMLQGRDGPLPARAPASRAPATMLQGRDGPLPSRAPASRAPATMLQGRDGPLPNRALASRAPATMLQGRDGPLPSRAPATMLQGRDNAINRPPPGSTLNPAIFASRPPPGLASVFITEADLKRARAQTNIDTLPEDEKEDQETWAQEQIAKTTNCPDGFKFARVPGEGYQCLGGAHGISDQLLREGLGGILVIDNKGKPRHEHTYNWYEMKGPYYPNPDGPGFIKALRVEEEEQ